MEMIHLSPMTHVLNMWQNTNLMRIISPTVLGSSTFTTPIMLRSKKAVGNMFLIMSDRAAAFTVSVDCDRSRFIVSTEIDSLRVVRDITRLVSLDDQITAFGQPINSVKKK
jgi:hypothetical protein